MKKSIVYLIKQNYLTSLKIITAKLIPQDKSKTWAIKLHMGERGNLNYIRPPIAGAIVQVLKQKHIKPFLFDTTTLYHGSRYTKAGYLNTAKLNGFTADTIGCPIHISNEGIKFKGNYLKNIYVAKKLANAEGMIVLSHFKGHPDAGFGGAIKNLGMGGVARQTKLAIHTLSQPKLAYDICVGCGKCVKVCPNKVITIKRKKSQFNYNLCYGCGSCIAVCPQKALSSKVKDLRILLAESAYGVIKQFKANKVLYINVLLDIAKHCDCFDNAVEAVCPNIGILLSKDIVAIEQASFNLVNEKTNNKFSSTYLFNSSEQIKYAKKLGLGDSQYNLRIVN